VSPGLETVDDVSVRLCPNDEPSGESVVLRYLGSGGILIRWRGHSVMTAPFFSNPSFARVGLGLRLPVRDDRIDAGLPENLYLDAMLIGHAHTII
jgi:L-ascorbate metabolism protein UlaG (beta-lactamase superfamily)